MPMTLVAANRPYFYDYLFSTLKLVQKVSFSLLQRSNKALIAASQIAEANFIYS